MHTAEDKLTKIEITIVILIVGALTANAVPAYQDYRIRSAVAEAFSLGLAAELAVTQSVATYKILPRNQAITGFIFPHPTASVSSVVISDDGSATITVTTTTIAGNGTITFIPTLTSGLHLNWDCTGGTLADKYRPPECR
jgi:type IV pilus assembly protein PilA